MDRNFNFKNELLFALCGLFGVSIYNLFLNLAMDFSPASNVSIIIATAPLFASFFAFFMKIEKPYLNFFIGFFISIIGIIVLNGGFNIQFGDIFSFISALGWAIYSVLVAKIAKHNYNIWLLTRKVIFYGIIFIIPSVFFLDFNLDSISHLKVPKIALNLIFIAIFASGICFVMWNSATKLIGALKTNVYVYLTPLITIFVAFFTIGENIGLIGFFGALIVIFGTYIAQKKNLNN